MSTTSGPVASASALHDPVQSPFSSLSNCTGSNPIIITTSTTAPMMTINDALTQEYPDLAQLSQEDLLALLQDDELFDAYLHTTPQALQLHRTYEQSLKSVIATAEKNQALKPALDELRSETAQLFNEATELKDRATYLNEAQQDMFKRYQPATQYARLQHATTAQEYLSEQLVNAFLDGGGGGGSGNDDESFARQYREVRKVYHRRALLGNKWSTGSVVWRT